MIMRLMSNHPTAPHVLLWILLLLLLLVVSRATVQTPERRVAFRAGTAAAGLTSSGGTCEGTMNTGRASQVSPN